MTDRFVIIVDDAEVAAWLDRLEAKALDPSGLMADIGELLTESSKGRFRTGLDPDGKPWAPLADGSGRTPLLLTGRMRDDIAPNTGRDFVEITMGAKQAAWHHFGTDPYTIRPRTKKALAWRGGPGPRKVVRHPGLPARRVIGFSRDDRDATGRLVVAWLEVG